MAVTLREHLWHRRDPTARLAVIRPDPARRLPPDGIEFPDWGAPVGTVFATGPRGSMSLQTDVAAQVAWLVATEPGYLLTLPSNLLALAQHLDSAGTRLAHLREVATMGEMLSADVRAECRRLLGVPIIDMYSCQEAGYIALQCPTGEQYHVQSEVAFVEVVDAWGTPCPPGQTGRVVLTPLHNFAMPLIRYDVGDYAEVGAACECGRGLPVLSRIMGRQRNMITLPTGETFWPTFAAAWKHVDAVRQIQLVQATTDKIRARIVGPRPLTADEETVFKGDLTTCLGYPFDVSFEYLGAIDRSETLKFEDFVSLVPAGARRS
jgi:phenylacetate-CoA ligase